MSIIVSSAMLERYLDMSFEKWVDFLNRNKRNKELLNALGASVLEKRRKDMGLVDYTDMKSEIENAPEPTTAEPNREYKLRIIDVRTGVSDKNDCPWFQPVFEVLDEPLVKEFNDFMWELRKDKLDAKAYARALAKFKVFVQAFEIDLSKPLDLRDDLVGKVGWAILGFKKDDVYGDGNTIKKYIARK